MGYGDTRQATAIALNTGRDGTDINFGYVRTRETPEILGVS